MEGVGQPLDGSNDVTFRVKMFLVNLLKVSCYKDEHPGSLNLLVSLD